MDSGAFRTIELHGGYPQPVEEYAALIRRYSTNGKLEAAVAQDYMCESFMLHKTGLTVIEHQILTVQRYTDLLRCDTNGVLIMPVLQGYTPQEYVDCLHIYGDLLEHGAWVGVGSVCKRNRDPSAILDVLQTIKKVRPDLRLHAFGVKVTALRDPRVVALLETADSMAWSFAARYEGRDQNSPLEAVKYAQKVHNILQAHKNGA